MKSIFSFTFIAAAALLGASHAAAEPIPAPATLEQRQYNTLTYEGCYSSSSGLSYNTSYQFNTKGYCQTQCVPGGYNVQATTNKTDCWCGNSVPPSSSKVDDSYCNDGCAGYGTEMCMFTLMLKMAGPD
jgi:cell wall integrity and stress response component